MRGTGRGRIRILALLLAVTLAAQDSPPDRQEWIRTLHAADEAARADARAAMAKLRARLAARDPAVAVIEKTLDRGTATFDFDETPFEEVRARLQVAAGIGIYNHLVPDATWAAPVTLHLKEVRIREALETALSQVGLDYTYDRRYLVLVPSMVANSLPLSELGRLDIVSLPAGPGGVSELDAEARKKLDARVVLEEKEWPLTEALAKLGEMAGLEVEVAPESSKWLVETRAKMGGDMPLYAFLAWIGPPLRVGFALREGVLIAISYEDMAVLTVDGPRSGSSDWAALTSLGERDGFEEFRHELTGIVFVKIPAGEFDMGSAEDEPGGDASEGLHHVRIERPFLLSKTEVTNDQFRRFADRRTYHPGHSSGRLGGLDLDAGDQPVVRVSWLDAHGFCEWSGLRLPTEEEWEYVARSGDGRMFPWGSAWPPPMGAANLAEASFDAEWLDLGLARIPGYMDNDTGPAVVGGPAPNRFGVVDMGGNVREWCSADGKPILRGGGWTDSRPGLLRCAARLSVGYSDISPAVGFRVALDCPLARGPRGEAGPPKPADDEGKLRRLIEHASNELQIRILCDEGALECRLRDPSVVGVKREDLFDVLLQTLGAHGFSMVWSGPEGAKLWEVVRTEPPDMASKAKRCPMVSRDDLERLPAAAEATLIVTLRHAETRDASLAVRSLAGDMGRIEAIEHARILLITATAESLRRVGGALETIDVPRPVEGEESLVVETGLFEVSRSVLAAWGIRAPGAGEGTLLDQADAEALWSRLIAAAGSEGVRGLHRSRGRVLNGAPVRSVVRKGGSSVRLSLLPAIAPRGNGGESVSDSAQEVDPRGISLDVGLVVGSGGESESELPEDRTRLLGREGQWLVWAAPAPSLAGAVRVLLVRVTR